MFPTTVTGLSRACHGAKPYHGSGKQCLPADRAIVFAAGDGAALPSLAELEKPGEPLVAQAPGNVAACRLKAAPARAVIRADRPQRSRP
jgi:hypothetical protein